MDRRFEGKVALITGAASGIGRATALAFAQEGANVVVSDIMADSGEETVRLILGEGGTASFVKADVSDPGSVEAMVQAAVEAYGRIDLGINNAGVGSQWTRAAEMPLEDWKRVIDINLNGVFYCLHFELKQMLQQGSGAIVNVSSVAGLKGLANSSAYSASKHGVVGLTKAAALEYARMNIRINAVCPVFTLTPMVDALFEVDPSFEERLKRNIPMRRYGLPADIASAILWLCSDSAGFVTGHALPVDGGIMAG